MDVPENHQRVMHDVRTGLTAYRNISDSPWWCGVGTEGFFSIAPNQVYIANGDHNPMALLNRDTLEWEAVGVMAAGAGGPLKQNLYAFQTRVMDLLREQNGGELLPLDFEARLKQRGWRAADDETMMVYPQHQLDEINSKGGVIEIRLTKAGSAKLNGYEAYPGNADQAIQDPSLRFRGEVAKISFFPPVGKSKIARYKIESRDWDQVPNCGGKAAVRTEAEALAGFVVDYLRDYAASQGWGLEEKSAVRSFSNRRETVYKAR